MTPPWRECKTVLRIPTIITTIQLQGDPPDSIAEVTLATPSNSSGVIALNHLPPSWFTRGVHLYMWTSFFQPCAPPPPLRSKRSSTAMSLQRIYQLDAEFAVKLDDILHENGFVHGLLQLPEEDLIQLISYLNDVSLPPEK